MKVAMARPTAGLFLGLLLGSIGLASIGRPSPTTAAPRLESDRAQVQLSLTGPLRLSGTTPLGLEALPAGHYRLNLIGPGLPSSVGLLTRSGDGRLSTRSLAGPLSLVLPPGYLHLEQGETGRGMTMAAVATAMAAGVLFKEIDRGRALDDEAQAERDYATAVSPEEFLRARLDFVEAGSRVSDARDMRNLWAVMLGYSWLGAAAETWLLTPTPRLSDRGAGNYRVSTSGASAGGALVRSVLVPGGGQRYLGHSGRGSLFLGAVGGLGALSLVAHDGYLSARRSEERARQTLANATNPEDVAALRVTMKQAADRTSNRNRLRWAGLGATVGVYLWNVLDTQGLARDHAVPGSMSLNVQPTGDGLMGQLTWRLN